MHSRTTTALRTLQDLPSIRLEAVSCGGESNRPDQQSRRGKREIFTISIDIYGSEKITQDVGKRLSRAHTYLQHPINLDNGVQYNNPHYYAVPGGQTMESLYLSPNSEREDQQTPVVDIAKVFDEVDQTRILLSHNADCRIRTPLLKYGDFQTKA